MKTGLNGKVAFVAGASQGLGRAIAASLAEEGCRLMLCARNAETLALVAADLHGRFGTDAACVAADLDSEEGTAHAVETTLARFGGADVLVTNNGGPPPGSFDETDEARWTAGWNRTLMSAVRLVRGFLPGMRERRFGRIIAVTSISVKQPIPRLLLSNAYRAAVTGMIRTLSDETAADGITANCIAPGFIATDRLSHLFNDRAARSGRTMDEEAAVTIASVPAGRLGRPEEVGDLAAFLASERAAYITGSTILVDGGMHRGLF